MKSLLILPAYNEEGKIGNLCVKASKFVSEILVIDDCSTDNTYNEARGSKAVVIKHLVNKGVGAAIKTGMRYALKHNFDVIFIMGGDAQDDPIEIPKFIAKIREDYDFIQGSRYLNEDSRNYPLFRLITTKLYTFFISLYSMKSVTDASNGYRAMTRKFVSSLDLNGTGMDRYEFETYLLLHALRHSRYTEVPVQKYYFTEKGYSKMKPFISWLQMFKPIIMDFLFHKMGRKA